MGMAGTPPPAKYKRTYWITEHAVDQLRRRFEKEGTDHRDDSDLGHLIDFRAKWAVDAGDYEDIKDDGIDARIVHMRDLGLWAMIKPNTNSRKRSSYPKAVVTLLEDWQVQRSKKSGKWEPERYDDGDVKVGGLSDEQREIIKQCAIIAPDYENFMKVPEEKVPEEKVTKNGLSWWVHYSTSEGARVPEEYGDKDAALKRMLSIFLEGRALPGTLKLSQEVIPEFTA